MARTLTEEEVLDLKEDEKNLDFKLQDIFMSLQEGADSDEVEDALIEVPYLIALCEDFKLKLEAKEFELRTEYDGDEYDDEEDE